MNDIYTELKRMAETFDDIEYYRCSKLPDMAAWDFEITQDRFDGLRPDETGYHKITHEFNSETEALQCMDQIPAILRSLHLDKYKCVFGCKEMLVKVVFNYISDDGDVMTEYDETPFYVMLKKAGVREDIANAL